jgi:cyclase
MIQVIKTGKADAVAMADVLHYRRMNIPEIRQAAIDANIHVRKP